MPTPKIIFDTDIGWDCDDAGALGLLHRLCDAGEAELLATVHCYVTPYVAGCLDAINTYYGRPVPVGRVGHELYADYRARKFAQAKERDSSSIFW